MDMFCYQCEQTVGGESCTSISNCGKDPKTAALQDLLVWVTKGVSMYAHRARELGAKDSSLDHAMIEALFTTVTNVNFDPERVKDMVLDVAEKRSRARAVYLDACEARGETPEKLGGAAAFEPADDVDVLVLQGAEVSIRTRIEKLGEDLTGLQELLTYGLKGTSAYVEHARILGSESDDVYAFFHRALDYLTRETPTVDELFGLCMECGQINLEAMKMLSTAHSSRYGSPEPTAVRIEPVKGKAILISGHDLRDLEALLEQTEGKGINVYTHSEMLPAHGYPGLKKYAHLKGNYGGAWQDQRKEFQRFPGAILMTTNCIQNPKENYKGRIFTSGLVAWPGVKHISDRDFSPVIEAALEAPGFDQNAADKTITVGFGHDAVLGVADKVVEAVRQGAIRHFFLVGGCDGAKTGRNYYTEFAQSAPDDTVILTLACGKYRFNKLDFGDIGGIPRLLDVGQCNDAYSAVQIALALADAFKTDVNSLPLSFVLSWYEQKAVAILLTLLSLGIKNIRLGPTLPAFVSANVLNVLVEKFNIMPITTASEDLQAILG